MQQFDVLIVGGGMAGATAAVSIKKQIPNCRIAVVEAFAPKAHSHPSFDDRSIALAEQSVDYLSKLNLFNKTWPFSERISQVNVSDRGHFGKASITPEEYQVDALGYVVEVNPYGQFLHQQLQSQDITLFCPAKVQSLTQHTEHVEVELDAEQSPVLQAKLLVIADGAHSPTRNLLNLEFDSFPYEQGALIANVKVSPGHQGQAFERFTSQGPIALLPMSDDRFSVAWCMNKGALEEVLALDDTAFLARLQQEFGYRGGVFEAVGKRSRYPLVHGRISSVVHHRVVVIGNAAHAIHPIAGQGFNLGMRDIQCLVSQLQASDIVTWGNHAFTQAYKVARDHDIGRVMTLTDGLVRLFSNESRSVAFGRSCGLMMISLFPTLKAPLARQLMGRVQ
ncbi:2-octaprenyl-6-methoxyphenyl hydroxylase [Pseudoalteromonas luteoviolacea]|nr:2-octaprenyl-6-methoxyphenyl hydroxylase [Pseudoalteromonas luteoviolacea]AOT06821.1 2-octaprenyl-6-methoxyphenyl hydroxylase [Pseudoalteromonas luteoviolacea]AOT11739.1 2-octaprenyl-6-methoxyphenyl hydroxylase [Pseudoalteromonas luteoviolacea]AOT16651.1 2-octaprenyl-6-methoxyphenyl hydroxylase [Pseudoalteromonas luteoviolacea]